LKENLFYVDAEFPDWHRMNPISIGLVAQSGESFYVELTDGWSLDDCSSFVRENVLPMLMGGKHACTTAEAKTRLYRWILSFGQRPLFVSDSHWDLDLMQAFLPALQSRMEMVQWNSPEGWKCFVQARELFFELPGSCKHHALHDALALKAGMDAAGLFSSLSTSLGIKD
jgi:hypothetical protein